MSRQQAWYERTIVPHIIRLGCGCSMMHDYRRQIVPHATGRVLELGMGAGANLGFYNPEHITSVRGIEPSAELRAMAAKAPRPDGLDIDIIDAAGEELPFDANCFDTIVSTFTLCTVDNVARTLAEAHRVLKPGGRFLFCEHGLAPDPGVQKWQHRIEPAWKRVFGGCHVSRPIRGSIERQFAIEEWTGGYQGKAFKFAGWMEWGQASAS